MFGQATTSYVRENTWTTITFAVPSAACLVLLANRHD